MASSYYYLQQPRHRWGDYGYTLVHGYGRIDEATKVCRLQRTGPFVPPFTQPGAIVVADAVRIALEASRLAGFSFVPVVKERIVALDWHQWDPSGDPKEYPESGEPEDYILAGVHSPHAASAMGDLWALQIPSVARVQRDRPIVESLRELHLVLGTTQGLDFVRSPDVGHCFVSSRARDWLQAHVGEWVEFEPASVR